jgi:hypothetical protein
MTSTHLYMHALHVYSSVFVYIHAYSLASAYIHAYSPLYMHIHQDMHINLFWYMHDAYLLVYTCMMSINLYSALSGEYACIYVNDEEYMHKFMHACIFMCICTYMMCIHA